MSTLNIRGNWNEAAGKLKQKFANLTDNDMLFREGREDKFLGKLQKKLGKAREEIRRLVEKI